MSGFGAVGLHRKRLKWGRKPNGLLITLLTSNQSNTATLFAGHPLRSCGQIGFQNRQMNDSRLLFVEGSVGTRFDVGRGVGFLRTVLG